MKVEVAELRLRIRQGLVIGELNAKQRFCRVAVHKDGLRSRRLCLNKLGSSFLPIAVELDYISWWK